MRQIKAGTTDVSVVIRIIDSTDGTPETGVVFNTSGIDLEYRREGAASTDITEATLAALTTAHSDGGFLHIGNGYYRLDLPDAACATGATGVLIHGTVTGMVVIGEYIELIENTTKDVYDRIGAPAGASVSADIAAIEAQTDDIGAAGAGLTAVPWNSAWDAEVQSEVEDALVVHRLDELLNADSDIDGAAPPTVGSVFHELMTKTTGSFTYDQTTDSLEAVRDNMGTAQTGDSFARLGAPAGASVSADIAAIKAETATIVADTNELQTDWTDGGRLDLIIDAILVDTGTTLQAEVDGIQADTEDIQSRLPAALVSGRIDASVGAMAANTLTASALAADAVTEIRSLASGTSDSGSTTTMVDAARTEADTDYWKGCYILFTSGSIAGQCRLITAFTPGTDTITFAPATTQAVGTETYEILPSGRADLQLWKGTAPNDLTAGLVQSSAQSMSAGVIGSTQFASGAITADVIAADAIGASELAADAVAEIADAVWDEAASGHTTAGTFGQRDYIIRANTAQAGAATTITLDASASATDDFYNNCLLYITAGTGAGQARFITDYVGSTKVATVATWATNPSSDSVFVIVPFGSIPGATAPTANEVADAVLTRNVSNVEGSLGEHTLGSIILATLEFSISGTTMTIFQTDGSTTHLTKTLGVDGDALPIVSNS